MVSQPNVLPILGTTLLKTPEKTGLAADADAFSLNVYNALQGFSQKWQGVMNQC